MGVVLPGTANPKGTDLPSFVIDATSRGSAPDGPTMRPYPLGSTLGAVEHE